MSTQAQTDTAMQEWLQQEAQLEQHLAQLRQLIAAHQYSAIALDQEQSPTPDCSLPEEEESPPPILLRELPLHDPLISKWNLGAGLPLVSQMSLEEKEYTQQLVQAPPVEGSLRLFGLLSSGKPWQCTIALSDIEQAPLFVLGRDAQHAQVVIPEEGVSREHVQLSVMKGVPMVSDLGSTNGIIVDGVQLSPFQQHVPLGDGMCLQIGSVELQVEIVEDEGFVTPLLIE